MYNTEVCSSTLLAVMAFSINFHYCCTVEQQEHFYSRNLNINTFSSSNSSNFSPSSQQMAFATSNTLSPPPSSSSSPPILLQSLSNTGASDTVQMQFVRNKYKLLDQLSVNKTALFKSIIKKRDINSNIDNDATNLYDNNYNNDWKNINHASRRLLMESVQSTSVPLSVVGKTKFSIMHNSNNISEIFPSSVINDTTQQATQTLVLLTNIINNSYNEKSDNDSNSTDRMQLCDEFEDENCIIDHNVVCVGDPQYCNLTFTQYTDLLLEYITPTTSEWILIVSHSVVFIMGLVSVKFSILMVTGSD